MTGTISKEVVDINKIAEKAGNQVQYKVANELRTLYGLQS